MDQFNFDEPIHATVIFESDDEFDIKPCIDDKPKETTNYSSEIEQQKKVEDKIFSSKIEEVQKKVEKASKNISLTPLSNTTKTETLSSNNSVIETTVRDLLNDVIIQKFNINVHNVKPLDMPSLEEPKNSDTGKSKENKTKENMNSQKPAKKEASTKNTKVSKRRITKNFNYSKEPQKTRKLSDENEKTYGLQCTEALNKNYNSDEIKTSKDCNVLKPSDGHNGDQKQNSNQQVVCSKYFVNSTPASSDTNIFPAESQKQNTESEKTVMINIEFNPPAQTGGWVQTNRVESQPPKESNDTLAVFFKRLLDTVSEHMIYILNSHQDHVKFHQTNTDPKLLEKSKNNFLFTRNNFFDLSYSTVVNIVIPHRHDPTFVKDFLSRTMKIGQSKGFNYRYEQIESVFYNMIEWAQCKQVQIQSMNMNKGPSSILLHELQRSLPRTSANLQNQQGQKQAKLNTSTHSRQPYSYESQNSYVPNYPGEPNPYMQQIYPTPRNAFMQQINPTLRNPQCNPHKQIDPTLRNPPNIVDPTPRNPPMQQINPAPRNPPMQKLNPTPRKLPPLYSNRHQPYHDRSSTLSGYSLSPSRITEQNHLDTIIAMCQQNLPRQEKQIPNTYTNQNTIYKSNENLQLPNPGAKAQPYLSLNIDVQRSKPHQNYTLPPWPNSSNSGGQKEAPHTWQNSSNASYPQEIQQSSEKQIPIQNNQQLQPEYFAQGETNRSISRDSGFMSPLNFNTNNDLPSPEEQLPQSSSMPLITHVTSLNPNASLIRDGNCTVCGKVTKQMCLGCFNCYYCSSDCQFLNWSIHQLVCTGRQTN